jgi:hypothetical protein
MSVKVSLFGMLLAFLLLGVVALALPLVLRDVPAGPPVSFGVFLLALTTWGVVWVMLIPYEVVLYGDGSLEFVGVMRRVRVRVSDIKSIRPEGSIGFLVVEAGSKVRIFAQFDDFHELLCRLKELNPRIVLRGC